MIVLQENPKGITYKQLIDVAFDVCDTFHLVLRNDMGPIDDLEKFLKKFESSLIAMKEESEWASTILGNGQVANVYYYSTDNAEIKRLIHDSVGSLYEWVFPYFPEDLSFFKDGKEWLATSSHEEECYIFPKCQSELDKVMRITGLKASIEEDD